MCQKILKNIRKHVKITFTLKYLFLPDFLYVKVSNLELNIYCLKQTTVVSSKLEFYWTFFKIQYVLTMAYGTYGIQALNSLLVDTIFSALVNNKERPLYYHHNKEQYTSLTI